MEREVLSFGSDATADETVLNSPAVVVPARTMMAPDGGVVLVAASTAWKDERAIVRVNTSTFVTWSMVPRLRFETVWVEFLNTFGRKYRGDERLEDKVVYCRHSVLKLTVYFTRGLEHPGAGL